VLCNIIIYYLMGKKSKKEQPVEPEESLSDSSDLSD
jgi:hypothetical protein